MVGTKRDRERNLHDPNILFYQDLKSAILDSQESVVIDRLRQTKIAVGASSSSTLPPPLPPLVEIPSPMDDYDIDAQCIPDMYSFPFFVLFIRTGNNA